jgi:hypothetical protein
MPMTDTGNNALRTELLARMRADQQARLAFAAAEEHGETDWSPVSAVDRDNLAFLEPLIDQHGWLGSDLVGEDGAHACWLLVQHTPAEHQERWLPLLRAAVATGRAAGRDLAYLEDRVALHNNHRQLHGTQSFGIGDGPIRLWPVADPAGLTARRARLGLPAIPEDVLDQAWTSELLARHNLHLDDESHG